MQYYFDYRIAIYHHYINVFFKPYELGNVWYPNFSECIWSVGLDILFTYDARNLFDFICHIRFNTNFKTNVSRLYNYFHKITNVYHTVYVTDRCEDIFCTRFTSYLDILGSGNIYNDVLVVFWNLLNLIDTDQRRENSRGQKLIKDKFNASNWSLYFKPISINEWHISM